MIKVEERSTIVGVTELRKVMKDILREIKNNKVILTRRNQPVGVILDYEEFMRRERLLEALEDRVLGGIALERAGRKDRKTITLEEVEKLLARG